jgi:putative tricarboxylic transport membrane protein
VGSFIPLLVLGVPGSETTAVMLGALITLGVRPGPTMLVDSPDIFWGVAASMFIGNLVLIVLNLPIFLWFACLQRYYKYPNGYSCP